MLPFGVAFGFFEALLAAAFLAHSDGTRVVCVLVECFEVVFVLDVVFFGAAFAAIFAVVEERGGEGGRPVDGANWAV